MMPRQTGKNFEASHLEIPQKIQLKPEGNLKEKFLS